MLPRKKYTWTVLLRLAFLGNEYSSEFFQTLLAVPHFRSVARKSQKQSSRGVLQKRCFWKKIFFHRTPPVAASEKLKAEAVVRRCSVKKVFFKIFLNSQENTCARASFLQSQECNFIKIESLTQAFSYELCKHLSKNTFFKERIRWLLP